MPALVTAPRRLHFALTLVALTLGGSACAPSPGASREVANLPRPAPIASRTITAAVGIPITGFSPIGLRGSTANIGSFFNLHSDGLVTSDAQGRPTPRIARGLPSLDNGTIRLLGDGRMQTDWALRPDVTWHDGTPFTAHDVAFGFRLHSDRELPYGKRDAVAQIESVQDTGQYSLVITWKQPFYLADSLGPLILFPAPAHLLEQEYATLDKPSFLNLPYWTTDYIHAGPFRLARFEPGQGATFEAYSGYFLGRPKVDAVVVQEILDSNALYAAILSGTVEMTIQLIDGAQVASLQDQWQGTRGGRVLFTSGPLQFFAPQFAPDLVNPRALLDPRVRRALYLALDRRALTDLAYGGRPTPEAEGQSLMPSSDPLYPYVKDLYADRANDPNRAAREFSGAGWSRGPDGLLINSAGAHFSLEVRTTQQPVGTAAASMWKSAGVDVNLVVVPPALRQDLKYGQEHPGILMTGGGQGDGIFPQFDGAVMPTASNGYAGVNRGHYNNPALSDLIPRYRATLRADERGQITRQIADLVAEDLPVLPTYFFPVYATVSSQVHALDDLDGGYTGGGGYLGGYARTAHLWQKD